MPWSLKRWKRMSAPNLPPSTYFYLISQQPNTMNNPTAAQQAFEQFRRTLSLPLMRVRVDGNLMTYSLASERQVQNFISLAKAVVETTDLPLAVVEPRNQHGRATSDYFVTIEYTA
jgi:hypothetical protein